ncbi:MAG: hypothetical protein HRU13_13885, partial [Phycisphaerales bacterium]|nr:hypothetical protein [Phycisphaerales bacterium]
TIPLTNGRKITETVNASDQAVYKGSAVLLKQAGTPTPVTWGAVVEAEKERAEERV